MISATTVHGIDFPVDYTWMGFDRWIFIVMQHSLMVIKDNNVSQTGPDVDKCPCVEAKHYVLPLATSLQERMPFL